MEEGKSVLIQLSDLLVEKGHFKGWGQDTKESQFGTFKVLDQDEITNGKISVLVKQLSTIFDARMCRLFST